MGRPTSLTREVHERICESVRKGATLEVAAKAAGVSAGSLYEWKKRGKSEPDSIFAEFLKDIKAAEGTCEVRLIEVIDAAAAKGTWTAAAWLLERSPRHGKRWCKKDTAEVIKAALQANYPEKADERVKILRTLLQAEEAKAQAA